MTKKKNNDNKNKITMKQKTKQLQSSGETRKTSRTWHFLSTLNSLLLSKLLLLLIILVMGSTAAWAAKTDPGYAGSSYLNLSNYSSIDDAGHSVSNLTHMYDYNSTDKVLRVSAYGALPQFQPKSG